MTPTPEAIGAYKGQIRNFLMSNFYIADAEALEDDTSLLDRGIIDSTGVLEVIGFIEETFGVTVEDSELVPENLDSVQGLARYVAGKRHEALMVS